MMRLGPKEPRWLRRHNRRALHRYAHGTAPWRNCNQVFRGFCLRCAWWSVTGKHARAKAEMMARFKVYADCPHDDRRPNTHPGLDPSLGRAEVCNSCGIGIASRA